VLAVEKAEGFMHKPVRALTDCVRHRRGPIVAACGLAAASIFISIAFAQYLYNPASADEGPGIRYFGSAKDENGALLPDVTVNVASPKGSYFLVTDDQGRFRVTVPLDTVTETVTLKCFKPGFELVRTTKRPGPTGPRKSVQVDCVLRGASSK
jgi:hypothetical protein